MTDELSSSSETSDVPKETDAIPRAFTGAADYLFTLDFLVHFVLGIVSIALGSWYAVTRPGLAVLVVAGFLAGYVLVHVWRHVTEHPRRDRGYRRRERARTES